MSETLELRVDRLRWAGPLTVLLSVGAVAVIREMAVAVVQPDSRYIPLLRPLPIFDTAVFGTAAVLVFARFCRDNAHRSLTTGVWRFVSCSYRSCLTCCLP